MVMMMMTLRLERGCTVLEGLRHNGRYSYRPCEECHFLFETSFHLVESNKFPLLGGVLRPANEIITVDLRMHFGGNDDELWVRFQFGGSQKKSIWEVVGMGQWWSLRSSRLLSERIRLSDFNIWFVGKTDGENLSPLVCRTADGEWVTVVPLATRTLAARPSMQ